MLEPQNPGGHRNDRGRRDGHARVTRGPYLVVALSDPGLLTVPQRPSCLVQGIKWLHGNLQDVKINIPHEVI